MIHPRLRASLENATLRKSNSSQGYNISTITRVQRLFLPGFWTVLTWSLIPWCRCSPVRASCRPSWWRGPCASGSSCCPRPPRVCRGRPRRWWSRRSRRGPQPGKSVIKSLLYFLNVKILNFTSCRTLMGTPMDMMRPLKSRYFGYSSPGSSSRRRWSKSMFMFFSF